MRNFRVALKLLPILFLLLALWPAVETTAAPPSQAITPTATPAPTKTPGASALNITFKEMGFTDYTMQGPFDNYGMELSVPDGWQIQPGSYLELRLSYATNMILKNQGDQEKYALLDILLDETLLLQHIIVEQPGEPFVLRASLPPEILNQTDSRKHEVTIRLDTSYICLIEHRYDLNVLASSNLHLEYSQLPIDPDLRIYPRPIYDGVFKRDNVLMILPEHPNRDELSSAAAISAKLGQAVGRQLIISATTDISVTQEMVANSHLFIIGQPENNRLISRLNAAKLLTAAVKPGEAQLTIRGPARLSREGVLSYTVAVTNSTTTPLNAPQLEVALQPEIRILACKPDCQPDTNGISRRSLPPLSAGQTTLVTFTLTVSRGLPHPMVNTTVALMEPQRDPLNVVTWSTVITGSPLTETTRTSPDYLFVFAGRAVPETDGVVQEIVSPWNQARIAVVASGATAEGLRKAGQALSTETYFPGKSKQVALVREVEKKLPERLQTMTDFTLADLGYADKTVYGYGANPIDFTFKVPFGWALTEDARAVIKFRHSVVTTVREATLSAMLNSFPVSSVRLDETNEKDGVLIMPLPAEHIYGGTNRLTLLSTYEPVDWCVNNATRNTWLTALSSSEIHLNHIESTAEPDLSDYPLPYALSPNLDDLLFALPSRPTQTETQALLRLSTDLGNASDGDGFTPEVALGDPNKELLDKNHVIVIGRPSVSPVIWRLNDALPQPFIPGTDRLQPKVDNIIFRTPPGVDVGCIEQIASIWNPAQSVLAVTGNSDQGVAWAAAVLSKDESVKLLQGNLAAVHGTEVHSLARQPFIKTTATPTPGTATPLPATPTPQITATLALTPTPLIPVETTETLTPSFPYTERLLLGLVIVALLLLTLAVLGVIWWRRRKTRRW